MTLETTEIRPQFLEFIRDLVVKNSGKGDEFAIAYAIGGGIVSDGGTKAYRKVVDDCVACLIEKGLVERDRFGWLLAVDQKEQREDQK